MSNKKKHRNSGDPGLKTEFAVDQMEAALEKGNIDMILRAHIISVLGNLDSQSALNNLTAKDAATITTVIAGLHKLVSPRSAQAFHMGAIIGFEIRFAYDAYVKAQALLAK